MTLSYRRVQNLCVVAFLISIFLIFCWFYPLARILFLDYSKKTNHVHESHRAENKSFEIYQEPIFAQFYMCPACFGYKACREIDMSTLIFHGEIPTDDDSTITWKQAILKNERVLITSPSREEWRKFDDFICVNSSKGDVCDASIAIRRTHLGSEQIMSVEGIRSIFAISDAGNKAIISKCATKRLLKGLIKVFDDDFDGYFSQEEQVMLFTSLLMHPGYVVAKFQTWSGINMPIPGVVGACGRSVIFEGGLTPLSTSIDESFHVRARYALQVLQIVEGFEAEDPQWYFVYTGFTLENLALTQTGEVTVLDLSEMVILDKYAFSSDDIIKENEELCNIICFQNITQELLHSSNELACRHGAQYTQLMYAIVCKQVLSDLLEHREKGFFNFDGYRIHKPTKIGLLHSIPPLYEEHVENLLRECVLETKPRGRIESVTELRKLLESIGYNDEFVMKSQPKTASNRKNHIFMRNYGNSH